MNSGIYKWTSPSGKSYIGQAVNLKRRSNEFLNFEREYTSKRNGLNLSAIDKARKKYNSAELWKYEVLEYSDVKNLDDLEIKYIAEFNTTDSKTGYNSTEGGESTKGYKFTKEQLDYFHNIVIKNRRSMKGECNPNYGNHLSDEAKERLRQAHLGLKASLETRMKMSKPVIQYTLDGEFIKEYYSITSAAQEVGCNPSLIMRVCQGKKKTAKGYIWKYKE